MPDMQQIEAAVGQSNVLSSSPPFGHAPPKLGATENLLLFCCAQ